jgi:hypothetical protein
MIQQALIHVTDLLDIEAPEAESPRSDLAATGEFRFEKLHRPKQMKNDAVINAEGMCGDHLPTRAGGAPFEEWEAVGIEERPAVSRETKALVLDATINGAEEGQQAAPSIAASFEDFLAVPVGLFLQIFKDGADGVVLVVERIATQQEFSFFCREKKDEAHHHRERSLVERALVHAGKESTTAFAVEFVE